MQTRKVEAQMGLQAQLRRAIVGLAAAVGLVMPALAGITAPARGATATLRASTTISPGLVLTAQTRPGPYFAGEALLTHISLRNTTKQAMVLQRPGVCRFAIEIDAPGSGVQSVVLPPAPICSGTGIGTIPLKPGTAITGTAMAVVPGVAGKKGHYFSARLHVTALLSLSSAAKAAYPAAVSAPVAVPMSAGPQTSSGGNSAHTLRASVQRDGQTFIIAVHDGRGHAVGQVTGWYVVQAPDGPLSWSIAAAGRIYCGPGCATSAMHGTYHFIVILVKDGYSVARASTTYVVR
ncbi:MAG TPA: hypothetical protein VHB98_21535 [Chloroflexota bacterium]|nr:hypothetical protein [Chloroflexota bacterium]